MRYQTMMLNKGLFTAVMLCVAAMTAQVMPAAAAEMPAGTPIAKPSASVDNTARRQATRAFVEKAAAYAKQHGLYAAIMAYNDPHGEFRQDNRYIFAMVCGSQYNDGFVLATNPDLEQIDAFTNTTGKYPIGKAIVEKTTAKGSWFDYSFDDPQTHLQQAKHSYAIRLPEYHLCIGSGYYERQ